MGKKVVNILKNKDINYLIEEKSADMLNLNEKGADFTLLREKSDIILLFGGDGTFLHTAHYFAGTDIPLLGINLGSLGFMTEIEVDQFEKALSVIIDGDYTIEKRMMLEARVFRDSHEVFHSYALNDVVINRASNAHLININLQINDEFINQYSGDGLILATPTGSTAYSLSAGGPIINPKIRAILITPICPHSLHIRPMVISEEEKIDIVVSGEEKKMNIATDGRFDYDLMSGDRISISVSDNDISLIKLPDRTFYTILREKMRVGLV